MDVDETTYGLTEREALFFHATLRIILNPSWAVHHGGRGVRVALRIAWEPERMVTFDPSRLTKAWRTLRSGQPSCLGTVFLRPCAATASRSFFLFPKPKSRTVASPVVLADIPLRHPPGSPLCLGRTPQPRYPQSLSCRGRGSEVSLST